MMAPTAKAGGSSLELLLLRQVHESSNYTDITAR